MMTGETFDLALKRPITAGDDLVKVLVLREPTVKQYRAAARAETGVASDIILIAEVSGVKREIIERLAARDFVQATAWLAEFNRFDPVEAEADGQVEDLFEFRLTRPVAIGNVKLEKLTLREPTAAQMRQAALGESGFAADVILIHLAGNVDPSLVEAMALRDAQRAARWLGNFTRSTIPVATR